MKAVLKDGILTITVPFDEKGKQSSTGKTILHFSGTEKPEGLKVGEKQVTVALNVHTPNK